LKAKFKDILKYLLFTAIAAFFLYLAFNKADWSKMLEDFRKADYRYVFLSMLMGYAAFISRGLRWNLLLEPLGKKAKPWNAINAISIGYFANALVPRAGEVMRCTSLKETDDIPLERLFGTVVLERVIDGILLLCLISLAFITQLGNLQSFFDQAFARADGSDGQGPDLKMILGAGFLLFVVLFLVFRKRIQRHPFFAKVRELWQGFKEGFKSLSKVKNKWAFYGHTLFIWSMYFLMIYVVMFALPATEDINLSNGLFVMVAGGMGMVVPTPGGIGSYHYLVQLALSVLGVDQADGLTFATLVHSGQLVMTLIAGFSALPMVYRARRILKRSKA